MDRTISSSPIISPPLIGSRRRRDRRDAAARWIDPQSRKDALFGSPLSPLASPLRRAYLARVASNELDGVPPPMASLPLNRAPFSLSPAARSPLAMAIPSSHHLDRMLSPSLPRHRPPRAHANRYRRLLYTHAKQHLADIHTHREHGKAAQRRVRLGQLVSRKLTPRLEAVHSICNSDKADGDCSRPSNAGQRGCCSEQCCRRRWRKGDTPAATRCRAEPRQCRHLQRYAARLWTDLSTRLTHPALDTLKCGRGRGGGLRIECAVRSTRLWVSSPSRLRMRRRTMQGVPSTQS